MGGCPTRSTGSANRPAPGSVRRSPSPPLPRSAPGQRSAPASTRSWSPRPAPARPSAPSCGASTGCSRPSRPKDKQKRCRVLYISPLKALGVDVERNLRAPLTGIRHTADRLGVTVPDVSGRRPLRRHPGGRPPQARHRAARHPDHHPRVAVPDAHQPGPRVAARCRDGDRRRGARGRRQQARRPPRGQPRAPRRAARRAGPADRPVRDGAPARGGRPLPRRQRPGRDRRAAAARRSGTSRSSSPSRT